MTGLQFIANVGLAILVVVLTAWGLSYAPGVHPFFAGLLYIVEVAVIFFTNVARQLGVK